MPLIQLLPLRVSTSLNKKDSIMMNNDNTVMDDKHCDNEYTSTIAAAAATAVTAPCTPSGDPLIDGGNIIEIELSKAIGSKIGVYLHSRKCKSSWTNPRMIALVIQPGRGAIVGDSLRPGDEIIRINNIMVNDDNIRNMLRDIRPLTRVKIDIIRRLSSSSLPLCHCCILDPSTTSSTSSSTTTLPIKQQQQTTTTATSSSLSLSSRYRRSSTISHHHHQVCLPPSCCDNVIINDTCHALYDNTFIPSTTTTTASSKASNRLRSVLHGSFLSFLKRKRSNLTTNKKVCDETNDGVIGSSSSYNRRNSVIGNCYDIMATNDRDGCGVDGGGGVSRQKSDIWKELVAQHHGQSVRTVDLKEMSKNGDRWFRRSNSEALTTRRTTIDNISS